MQKKFGPNSVIFPNFFDSVLILHYSNMILYVVQITNLYPLNVQLSTIDNAFEKKKHFFLFFRIKTTLTKLKMGCCCKEEVHSACAKDCDLHKQTNQINDFFLFSRFVLTASSWQSIKNLRREPIWWHAFMFLGTCFLLCWHAFF